ncbi:MAG: hypothetical protein QOE75_2040 [Solirubrobacterales bacterium]|nr:hypothetical protein [Solirubrobacterales bacterium]
MDRSLRKLLTALATGLALVVMAVPASASAAAVPARAADTFVDSIGINTHTYYTNTEYYQDFGTVTQRLKELGVRHVRENLVPNRSDQYKMLNSLAAQGIKSTLILGDPREGSQGLAKLVSIAATMPGAIDALEGPNEWDLTAWGTNWMSTLAPYQAELWQRVKATPSLAGIPVVGPSLGNTDSVASDLSGYLEFGNLHSYPNAEPPEWNLSNHLKWSTRMSASKPVMSTETGYHNAMAYSGGHRPLSEAAEAVYLPRLFLEYYRRGIVRTFSYELLDEFPDSGKHEAESNFGLLRNDLSPKPAYTALQNLIAICSDSGGSFAPGKLDYTVSGDQTELRQLLLQKSDGSYYLALWRATSVWNNKSLQPVNAPSSAVKIDFAGGVAGAEEFAPNTSSQPLRKLPAGESLSVNVGPQVTILRLGATGEPLDTIKVWVDEPKVESGDPVVVEGRMAGTGGKPRKIKVQRWNGGKWKTVAKGRTAKNGRFKKSLRLLGGVGSSKIRVIADRAKPSNQVRVRVLAPSGGPLVALGEARRTS